MGRGHIKDYQRMIYYAARAQAVYFYDSMALPKIPTSGPPQRTRYVECILFEAIYASP